MKKNIKNLSLGLALLLGLAACSNPNSPSGNLGNNTQAGSSQNQQASTVSVSSSQQITADLASYSEDQATFSDSEKLASQESGFGTKALAEIVAGKKTSELGDESSAAHEGTGSKSEVRVDMKARLDASGAITKNADGSVTVNKDLLKSTVKQFITDHKVEIQSRIDKVKDKLKDKKEVSKDKAEKLKHKKAKARTSNVAETTNADGSVTKIMSVEFKTDNMTKENIVSKTTLNGKMISMSHTLKITTKAFTKDASRIITFNADGSKTIVTSSVTTFTDGRKREVNETRTVAAGGSGSGTGTITVTDKDGKITAKNLDTKITTTASGDEEVSSTSTDGKTTVTLNENASGKATAAIAEAGKPAETAEVDVEEKEEAEASAS